MFTWWWHTLGMLGLAGLLLMRGLRGRYVGDEPRCKRCTYQLAGAWSDLAGEYRPARCPECGAELNDRSMVAGLRKRRWGSLIALVLIPLLWVPSQRLIWHLQSTYWYHYYPMRIVFRDAGADQLPGVLELERRLVNHSIGDTWLPRLTELATVQQENWTRALRAMEWARIIALLDGRGLFSAEQKARLFPQLSNGTMTVRPVIRQGEYVVVKVDYPSSAAGLLAYRFWIEPTEIRVGGQVIYSGLGDGWRHRRPDAQQLSRDRNWERSVAFPIDDLPAGRHLVELAGRQVFMFPQRRPESDDPSWTSPLRFTGEVEILPANATDPVTSIDDPTLVSEFQDDVFLDLELPVDASFRAGRFTVLRRVDFPVDQFTKEERSVALRGADNHEWFQVQVDSDDALPVDVAFEVLVQAGNRESACRIPDPRYTSFSPDCTLVSRANSKSRKVLTVVVDRFEEEEIYVIFRSSRDLARQTMDVYRIWEGELRFGPLKVSHASR